MQRVDIAVEAAKVGGAVLRSVRQTDLKIEEKAPHTHRHRHGRRCALTDGNHKRYSPSVPK